MGKRKTSANGWFGFFDSAVSKTVKIRKGEEQNFSPFCFYDQQAKNNNRNYEYK